MRKSRAGDTESRTNGNFGREERILRIAVLIKQVPAVDTVKIDEKTGTMIRDGVEAELNPLDLHAVEAAVRLKESRPAGEVEITAVTMGPPAALKAVRYAIAMGCDKGLLLSDRKFGGADTLATSYALSAAIKKIGHYDLIIAGRQAIDGDTAQVAPQVAEKLHLPHVTYAEKIVSISNGKAVVTRRIETGVETVEAPLPLVITVNGSADECRPRNARRIQKYKYAVTPSEKATLSPERLALVENRPYLELKEWSAAYVDADPEQIGLKGSPTKVKGIVNVVFQAKESKRMEGKDQTALEDLVKDLIANHTIG